MLLIVFDPLPRQRPKFVTEVNLTPLHPRDFITPLATKVSRPNLSTAAGFMNFSAKSLCRAEAASAARRCWRRCAGPRHRVSAAKRTPSGETAWGPEVLQFRLWPSSGGVGGMGSRPVRLNSTTQQLTPLQRQLRLCIARTICSYHSRLGRKGAILQGVLGRG